MKNVTRSLSRQLLSIIVIIFCLTFIFLGIILPKTILPVAERNIYNYLREPLELIESDIDQNLAKTEIGYLYIFNHSISVSDNLYDIIDITNIDTLIKKINEPYGKFVYHNKVYYYYTIRSDAIIKVAITDSSYTNEIKHDAFMAIFPIVLLTFLIISLTLIFWSSNIIRKIEKLKEKIDHIDDDDYPHNVDISTDDELRSLALAIEDMRISLKNQEEYRNQMYQNISHDFKTPLTVIKSYIEAVHDGVEDSTSTLAVIEEQTNKLEQKVHSLLYLNKLDYLKESKSLEINNIRVNDVIDSSVKKFKFQRKDVTFKVNMDKDVILKGTTGLWETIIDNILGNFMRYATSQIKITVKSNKMVFYNDGPCIDKDLLDGIFTPFRKGIKGEFGLGLSIVKKTLQIVGYDITIKNQKKGVSFIIYKET